jgi:hypothetical protein
MATPSPPNLPRPSTERVQQLLQRNGSSPIPPEHVREVLAKYASSESEGAGFLYAEVLHADFLQAVDAVLGVQKVVNEPSARAAAAQPAPAADAAAGAAEKAAAEQAAADRAAAEYAVAQQAAAEAAAAERAAAKKAAPDPFAVCVGAEEPAPAARQGPAVEFAVVDIVGGVMSGSIDPLGPDTASLGMPTTLAELAAAGGTEAVIRDCFGLLRSGVPRRPRLTPRPGRHPAPRPLALHP